MDNNSDQLLLQIHNEVVGLIQSPLYQNRVKNGFLPVVGEGNSQAKIMFIAEAPGINEVKTGHHFQGAAGKIFDQLIASINLDRNDIYITNIIKDKLPQNRDPLPEEINIYAPFLIRQIKIIKPKVIITIGRFSTNYLLETCHLPIQPIGQIHGKIFNINCSYGKCQLVPMFHTAAALYNTNLIEVMKKDFLQLKNKVKI